MIPNRQRPRKLTVEPLEWRCLLSAAAGAAPILPASDATAAAAPSADTSQPPRIDPIGASEAPLIAMGSAPISYLVGNPVPITVVPPGLPVDDPLIVSTQPPVAATGPFVPFDLPAPDFPVAGNPPPTDVPPDAPPSIPAAPAATSTPATSTPATSTPVTPTPVASTPPAAPPPPVAATSPITVPQDPRTAPNPPPPDDRVDITLAATDLNGNVLSSVSPGQTFVLHVYARDIDVDNRATTKLGAGIYSAYTDVTFDASDAHVSGELQFSSPMDVVRRGHTDSPGEIRAAGSTSDSQTPTGLGQQEIFSIRITVDGSQPLTFTTAHDATLGHDMLVYGSDAPVLTENIAYGTLTLAVDGAAPAAAPSLTAASSSPAVSTTPAPLSGVAMSLATTANPSGGLLSVAGNSSAALPGVIGPSALPQVAASPAAVSQIANSAAALAQSSVGSSSVAAMSTNGSPALKSTPAEQVDDALLQLLADESL